MAKKLALVVHGIGEQNAGETLDRLVGAYSGDQPCSVQSDVRYLCDQQVDQTRQAELFPCHIRRVDTVPSDDDTDIVFAEVYWADLSKGATNLINSIIELLKLILGLGYVVRDNTAEKNPFFLMRWASQLFVWLIHGPIMASNLANASMLILMYAAGYIGHRVELLSWMFDYRASIAAGVSALLCFLAYGMVGRQGRGFLFQRFLNWLGYFGVALVLGLAYVWFVMDDHTSITRFYWFADKYTNIQKYAWAAAITAVLIMIVGQQIQDKFGKDQDSSVTLYPITASLMTLMFFIVVSLMWAVLLTGLDKMPHIDEIFSPEGWSEVVKQAVGATGIIWPSFFLLILGAAATYFLRSSQVKAYKKNRPLKLETAEQLAAQLAYDKGTIISRLIVHPIVYWVLFAIGILLYLSLLTLAWQTPVKRLFGDAFGLFYESGQVFALTAGAAVLVGYNFIWRPLASGLGVGKDIIGYFAVTRTEDTANPEMEKITSAKYVPESLDPKDRYRPLIRDRINGRFATVLKQMVAAENPDEVIIISHSQGTVVAYEAIRDGVLGNCGVSNCKLITMGSPLWHVYKRYFPSRVDLLDRNISGLDTWDNIYRIDDYVGTSIGDIDGDWPINHPVPEGGHLGYWSDSEVRKILSRDALSELSK
jgi:hypothetical protein